jgi:Uma2 family endonuclease
MTTAIQQILKRPDAPKHLATLQKALAEEAERRQSFYNWIEEDVKAEFINGEIILHSPVKRRHLRVSEQLSRILSVYAQLKKVGTMMIEKAMIALTRNDYEPDIVFFKREKAALFHEDQMLFPAPDFVVEILSKGTARKDKGIKKEDYALHGVKEYWIIDPIKQTIEQYLLINSTDTEYFPPYIYRIDDDIESQVVEGFKIPVRAIFEEEANLEAMKNLF